MQYLPCVCFVIREQQFILRWICSPRCHSMAIIYFISSTQNTQILLVSWINRYALYRSIKDGMFSQGWGVHIILGEPEWAPNTRETYSKFAVPTCMHVCTHNVCVYTWNFKVGAKNANCTWHRSPKVLVGFVKALKIHPYLPKLGFIKAQ